MSAIDFITGSLAPHGSYAGSPFEFKDGDKRKYWLGWIDVGPVKVEPSK